MAQLLDLPPEIIVGIICYLDIADIVSITRINRALYDIKNFQIIQYRFALHAAALEDSPDSNLVVAERLQLLQSREEGWGSLNVDFRRTIPIQHTPAGIYDMTGGIYFLGDASNKALHFCKLPSKPGDPATWSRIDIDRSLVDIGLVIYEHDLVAIVITCVVPLFSHCLSFSTFV